MIYPIERRKRRTGRKIEPTEDRVNLIIEYYNQDISYKEMCQLTGYSVPTIKKIIEQRRKVNQNNIFLHKIILSFPYKSYCGKRTPIV